MNLTLAEAAMGAGAVLEAPASVPNAGALLATGYSIDSRTVAPDELFFAVRGERHDGHDFVSASFERGAVAASRPKLAGGDATLAVLMWTAAPLAILAEKAGVMNVETRGAAAFAAVRNLKAARAQVALIRPVADALQGWRARAGVILALVAAVGALLTGSVAYYRRQARRARLIGAPRVVSQSRAPRAG